MLSQHLNANQIPLVNLLRGFMILRLRNLRGFLFWVECSLVMGFQRRRNLYFYQTRNHPYIPQDKSS